MSLRRIFDARSVAVVGASRDEKKRGFQAIRALLDSKYEGVIHPIHPREETILGLRCAPTVLDVLAWGGDAVTFPWFEPPPADHPDP